MTSKQVMAIRIILKFYDETKDLGYISSEFSGYLVTTQLFFYNNLVVCR